MISWNVYGGRQLMFAVTSIAALFMIVGIPNGAEAQRIDYGHRLGLQRGGGGLL